MSVTRSVIVAAVLFGLSAAAAANEAEVTPATPTLEAPPATPTSAESVTFDQQGARVGDRVAQSVATELQVQTTITQAGQEASASDERLNRQQKRFIEVLEVAGGNVRRAHISYPKSRITESSPSSNAESCQADNEIVQPVEQKSYFVTRAGDRLLVTDCKGSIPPQAEYEIVVTSLKNLGLPNPLIEFLLGRTVRIGERLQLPKAIAEQLMGFSDDFGSVENFELELKAIQEINGKPCAQFASTIEAVGDPANPVRIRAFGEVVIQTQTCRVVRAELSGPMTLSVVQHTPQGSFQYAAQGSMRIAVESQYGHARQ